MSGIVRWLWLGMVLHGCTGAPADQDPEPIEPPTPVITAGPALLLSQAWFEMKDGKPVTQPARLVILRKNGDAFEAEQIADEGSNVFHKAMPWRDGILTIGAEDARLVHWTGGPGAWTPKVLWQQSWGGQFDRLRDIELGDVDGDGADEIVIATHDQGVVAIGDEADGAWTFTELSRQPDTFVHEIEIGDVDGDGQKEFYSTPSARNKASLESQPGGVAVYKKVDGAWTSAVVIEWQESHAKEILVADLGKGDQLFAVREGHTEKRGAKVEIIDPVRVVRLDPAADGTWTSTTVATLEDQQCRFLVPGDVDGDGTIELVAAGMKSGLWLLEPQEDGTFTNTLIDGNSSGFEHTTHVADLDGDGRVEIYVAADNQKQLRRYTWNGASFDRTSIADIPSFHISWNLANGTL